MIARVLRSFAAVSAALLSSSGYAAAPEPPFDLVCTGTEQTVRDGPEAPWSGRFHVNLDEQTYCREACADAQTIQSVSPDRIVFYHDVTSAGGGAEFVERANGRYMLVAITPTSFRAREATCRRAAYTGPRRIRRF